MRGRLALAVLTAALGGVAWAAQPPPDAPQPQPQPQAQAQAPPDPKAILQGACVMCHGVDFIAEHRKDRADWDFTVHRMMDKGAELSVDEADLLIDYLARTYPKPSAAPPP